MKTEARFFVIYDPLRDTDAVVEMSRTDDGRWSCRLKAGDTLIDRKRDFADMSAARAWSHEAVARANRCLDIRAARDAEIRAVMDEPMSRGRR